MQISRPKREKSNLFDKDIQFTSPKSRQSWDKNLISCIVLPAFQYQVNYF
tara:strand:- start:103 stop:252 length:150 start_codon:yes stop_codon:yes gene_type:complete